MYEETNQQWGSPSSCSGVDIRTTDTTIRDVDINVIVSELFGNEVYQFKFVPFLSILDTGLT